MNASDIFTTVAKQLKLHSPEILTALGASGVITTAYLASKASFEASDALVETSTETTLKEKVKLVWKFYIPAGISATVSVGCILGASKANTNRTAAAVTAYTITEKAFSNYREKVVEQIGKGKEQKTRDELNQEKVTNNPLGGKEVIILGRGNVLCCELYTHRYFRSDMETLRKAENALNKNVVNDLYVTLDEFYDILGLPGTSNSAHVGWNSDKLVELEFSTVISEDGEPCLAFDYNYIKPIK